MGAVIKGFSFAHTTEEKSRYCQGWTTERALFKARRTFYRQDDKRPRGDRGLLEEGFEYAFQEDDFCNRWWTFLG